MLKINEKISLVQKFAAWLNAQPASELVTTVDGAEVTVTIAEDGTVNPVLADGDYPVEGGVLRVTDGKGEVIEPEPSAEPAQPIVVEKEDEPEDEKPEGEEKKEDEPQDEPAEPQDEPEVKPEDEKPEDEKPEDEPQDEPTEENPEDEKDKQIAELQAQIAELQEQIAKMTATINSRPSAQRAQAPLSATSRYDSLIQALNKK